MRQGRMRVQHDSAAMTERPAVPVEAMVSTCEPRGTCRVEVAGRQQWLDATRRVMDACGMVGLLGQDVAA